MKENPIFSAAAIPIAIHLSVKPRLPDGLFSLLTSFLASFLTVSFVFRTVSTFFRTISDYVNYMHYILGFAFYSNQLEHFH